MVWGPDVVECMKRALPEMACRWKGLMREGYEARMRGEPRQWHGRRYSGPFFKGWDQADKEIREREQPKDA